MVLNYLNIKAFCQFDIHNSGIGSSASFMQVLAELTFPDMPLSKTKNILHNVGTYIFLNQDN